MQRFFRFLLLISVIFITTLTASAQSEKGQKTFGLRAGYVTRNESATAGLTFSYSFTRHFRLAPSVDYVFSHNSTDGMLVNLEYQGPYSLNAAGTWQIYPIAGINYTSWHHKDRGEARENSDDVSTRKNRFGINLGGGLEYYATPSLKLSLEGRFNWVRHYETGLFTLGISYVF